MSVCKELPVGRDASVAVNVVWALRAALQSAGMSPEQLTAVTGEREGQGADIRPRPVISRDEMYQLCERALSASGDDALGLHWGERNNGYAMSVLPELLMNAETLRDAFEIMIRYSRLLSDDPGLNLEELGDEVSITCRKVSGMSPAVRRFACEMSLVGAYRVARAYRSDAQPLRITFDYPAPEYAQEYKRIFGDSVVFDADKTCLVFHSAILTTRSPCRDSGIYDALHALAERRLREYTTGTTYAARVREFLMRQPAPHRVSMQATASDLLLSVRSLQRRLAEEGTSYSRLTNDASAAIAKRLIAEERHSVKEAAYLMGFTDPNSFYRAFKRWTGTTPSAFRASASS